MVAWTGFSLSAMCCFSFRDFNWLISLSIAIQKQEHDLLLVVKSVKLAIRTAYSPTYDSTSTKKSTNWNAYQLSYDSFSRSELNYKFAGLAHSPLLCHRAHD